MRKFCMNKFCLMVVGTLLALPFNSCQDDDFGVETVEEGLPAVVNLKINAGDMDLRSRSIADDDAQNRYCANLWIGIYSSETGKIIGHYYFEDVANTAEVEGEYYKLAIKTESANKVYIVGVANDDVNDGVPSVKSYSAKSRTTLHEMLDDADTFEKFKQVCVLRPDAHDVNVYANTLTMSGWYSASSADAADPSKMAPVNISPGIVDLPGAVYLRRVISYNKFNIYPGDENINLTVNSWQVFNVPAGCYLLEQDGNAGDNYNGNESFYNTSNVSRLFSRATDDSGTSGSSFEFYQLENKHNATPYEKSGDEWAGINSEVTSPQALYNQRESEYKQDGETEGTLDNTGIYRSLVNLAGTNMENNYASYVVVNASLDYYIDGTLANTNPQEADPVPSTTPGAIHRTANVNYTIHLGWCKKIADDGFEEGDAEDFNCYRNTKYTYNVYIKGVKDVVVEAHKDGETAPGTDGWVEDETGEYKRLDCHYCEFNIALTDKERDGLAYRITAPYGDTYYYYSRDKDGNVEKTEGINEELYNWIKFKPTTGKDVLAKYDGGKDLWTFNDMCSPTAKTNPADPDEDGNKWYTVFIDEYVYHFDDKGGVESSWPYYADKDDRVAEFIMTHTVSTDQKSTYSYCKYAFSQRSIQTFYKSVAEGEDALGVEHEEETYCMNMNWTCISGGWSNERLCGKYDLKNGRYDIFLYLDENRKSRKWSDYIDETTPCIVNEDTGNGCYHPDHQYPVYVPNDKTSKSCSGDQNGCNASPKDSRAFVGQSICMNRNRNSTDGDDIIDTDVKWYLPTSAQYIQIAIAQNEMVSPFIKFTDIDVDYFYNKLVSDGERQGIDMYHYMTADFQYYWAEQAVNTGDNVFKGWWPPHSQAYTARCVRNLGTNLSKPTKDVPEIDYAFEYDANTMTFTQGEYKDETLRGYNPGFIPSHDFVDPSARPYKKFEAARHICKNITGTYMSFNENGRAQYRKSGMATDLENKIMCWTKSLDNNEICGQYTQETDKSDLGTWRVPTAYEMALMWIEGLPQDTENLEAGYVSDLGENNSYFLSGTHDYFYTQTNSLVSTATYRQKYLGYNDRSDREVPALDAMDEQANFRLRCVRDVR